MKKRIIPLLFLAFLPLFAQLIVQYMDSYFIGSIVRIITHIFIPVIALMLFTNSSFKEAFLLPLHFRHKKKTLTFALICSVGALIIILSALYFLHELIDFSSIRQSIASIGVNKITYPLVGLFVILVNPFLEEYFWRGFVFRIFDKYYPKYSIYTGVLFALHHVIIVIGWFNWWQFLIAIIFLALIGVLFNWVYKQTDSIYTTWFVHFIADLIFILIGWFLLFN